MKYSLFQWFSIGLKQTSVIVTVTCESWDHSDEERYVYHHVNMLLTAWHKKTHVKYVEKAKCISHGDLLTYYL